MTPLRLSAVLLLALVLLVPLPVSAQTESETRLHADDNVGAAIAWSRFGAPEGGRATVLLARDDRFADALSSGGVQGLLGAPLLLNPSGSLDERVGEEIERLGARQVVLLGGEAAISSGVETELRDRGLDVERVWGDSRLTTATALATRYFPSADSVVVARAFGDAVDETRAFADSLGAGVYAAQTGRPVLLTASDHLSATVVDYLRSSGARSAMLIGGPAALSWEVRREILDMGLELMESYGPDRFSTAYWLAERAAEEAGPHTRAAFVAGEGDDAWAAGLSAAAHAKGTALLLTRSTALTPDLTRVLVQRGYPEPPICGPLLATGVCDQAVAASTAAGLEDSLVAPMPLHDDGDWRWAPVISVLVHPTARDDALCSTTFPTYAAGVEAIELTGPTGTVVLEIPEGGCSFGVDPALVADVVSRPASYEIVVVTDHGGRNRGRLFAVNGVANAELSADHDNPMFMRSSGMALVLGNRDDPAAFWLVTAGYLQDGTAEEGRLLGDGAEVARWPVRQVEDSSDFLESGWFSADPVVVRGLFEQPGTYTVEIGATGRTLRGALVAGEPVR